jgi:hypothetical protein
VHVDSGALNETPGVGEAGPGATTNEAWHGGPPEVSRRGERMMATIDDSTRRFTDQEVAVVLRTASEIDAREGAIGGGGGLSLEDLREIAAEVGISPRAIERAVARLDSRARAPEAWVGAPLVRRAVRAVPGELDRESVARLIHLVDERTTSAGAISEALGSVRWTTSDRLRSSLVTITPAHGETTIQVVEKTLPRIRRIFHLLPAAWSAMIAGPIVGAFGISGPVGVAAVLAGSAVLGVGIGRGVWNLLSVRSGQRVEKLAAALSEEAARAAGGEGK